MSPYKTPIYTHRPSKSGGASKFNKLVNNNNNNQNKNNSRTVLKKKNDSLTKEYQKFIKLPQFNVHYIENGKASKDDRIIFREQDWVKPANYPALNKDINSNKLPSYDLERETESNPVVKNLRELVSAKKQHPVKNHQNYQDKTLQKGIESRSMGEIAYAGFSQVKRTQFDAKDKNLSASDHAHQLSAKRYGNFKKCEEVQESKDFRIPVYGKVNPKVLRQKKSSFTLQQSWG
jgi:hypothetical protein